MAAFLEDIIDIDIGGGSFHRSFSNFKIGEGDALANCFGVRVFKDGEAVDMTGSTVTGYFIRENGTTITINGGTVTGNLAKITLPSLCYEIEGNFKLSIKVSYSGVTTTLRVVDGTVVDTVLGTIYDETGGIPDLDELLAVIGQAEDAADAIETISISTAQIENTRYRIIVSKTE